MRNLCANIELQRLKNRGAERLHELKENRKQLQETTPGLSLRLAVETEEERRARLENDAATKRLSKLAMETWTKKEKQD